MDTRSAVVSSVNSLSYVTKFSYGVGHVLNDVCASMWFTYLLVFFERVLEFSASNAGLVILVGQLADGFSTPVVGIFSDKENKMPSCAKYGRRKIWHLAGTVLVITSFPFVFSPSFGIDFSTQGMETFYYCIFVTIFQFGWAAVQISHLSLIPELTPKKHSRTELNSIRYACTVLSNLTMYIVAFLLLGFGESIESEATTPIPQLSNNTSANDGTDGGLITPEDAVNFRNMALIAVCIGSIFSVIFHLGVKEPPFRCQNLTSDVIINEKTITKPELMKTTDWFKQIAFYQVALLYMTTRLFVNLYQVYIPLYVQDTLHLDKTAVATVPFAIYLSGFCLSLVMKGINKKIGRKMTFILGCIIGIIGCLIVAFGESESYRTWGIYCAASFLGMGGSTLLITSLSITADLIGCNVEGGAFVYGFMSFTDKVANGIVIVIIQNLYNSQPEFYRLIITYVCGSCCILGILTAISLIPVKVCKRRGLSKQIAEFLEDENEKSSTDLPVNFVCGMNCKVSCTCQPNSKNPSIEKY